MRRLSPRARNIAVAAAIIGTVLVLVGGYLMLSKDSEGAGPSTAPTSGGTLPDDSLADGSEPSATVPTSGDADIPADWIKAFGTNPFTGIPRNNRIYDVAVSLRADGPMKYLYRFPSGDTPPKGANGSASISKRIRGPRAVAQVFVQVLPPASYATCSISIDGEPVSTATARDPYQVVACLG